MNLRAMWWKLTASLWFLPALLVTGSILLAIGLVQAEAVYTVELQGWSPMLFGATADGGRDMLTAIAGSMITVAGVVFSVTVVALSLASTQYSPRVLRTFMSDRPTQLVLGTFVGMFAYCIVVLRTIRSPDGGESFVPSLAVLGGMVLSLFAIALLVYFIHHLAASIQASTILERLTLATRAAIDALFPSPLGEPAEEEHPPVEELGPWTPIPAMRAGYLISVTSDALLAFSRKHARIVRMASAIGEFVVEGQPLVYLQGGRAVDEAEEAALRRAFAFDGQRTVEQDAGHGLQQIVDIGRKALSPGINDPSTALLCVDRLTELLCRLAGRHVESPYRRSEGRLAMIALGPSFDGLVELAYHGLVEDAGGKYVVLRHLLSSLERVSTFTADAGRRRSLAREARRVLRASERGCTDPEDREFLVARARELGRSLELAAEGA